jgi:hypothetical protein
LARAPSKECGRCSLTKFGLAQFTARLFWRFGDEWHLAPNIFDALSPHTVAASYMRPIYTPRHKTHFLSTRAFTAKPPGSDQTGGFALAAQTMPTI